MDALALLDMLHGFAQMASGTLGGQGGRGAAAMPAAAAAGGRGYVRPVLTEGGPIALVEARHPVLECLDGGAYQPNDTFLALNSAFHVIMGGPGAAHAWWFLHGVCCLWCGRVCLGAISWLALPSDRPRSRAFFTCACCAGPNMSGKSIYLRQVALCCVMAQVGAFVPATFASLPPRDRLLSRLGTGDSLETCSSSFLLEMQVGDSPWPSGRCHRAGWLLCQERAPRLRAALSWLAGTAGAECLHPPPPPPCL